MNSAQFKQSVLVIALLYLLPVGITHAQTLTLTQPFTHEGLTFSSPLNFGNQPSPVKPVSIEFGTVDEIDVQPTTQKQVAIETIVTPTPAPDTIISHPDYTTGLVTPTPSPTMTPTPTFIPTQTPTPTLTPTVITTPSNPGGLNADILFQMVNDYRATKNLPAFQKDDRTCSLASSRAPEIANEVATNTMHSGLRARNLPYWNTENIISMNSEAAAFNWWINDEIHKEAIESSNSYSCMSCSGNSCAEEFTSYQPK